MSINIENMTYAYVAIFNNNNALICNDNYKEPVPVSANVAKTFVQDCRNLGLRKISEVHNNGDTTIWYN